MTFIKMGHGPAVVLSHALGLDRGMWADVATLLAARHTVVTYDHPGHGQEPPAGSPVRIEDLADHAASVVQKLDARPVVFVGLSLGGMVGLSLAARHPSLLRGLAVLNSAAFYPDKSIWTSRVSTVRAQGVPAIADGSLDRWLTPAFRLTERGRVAADALRETLCGTDPDAYTQTCEAIAGMDLRDVLPSIETRTLVVAGRQDLATPTAMARDIADRIPGAELVEVDAAHISAVEIPDEVASIVERWIRSLR